MREELTAAARSLAEWIRQEFPEVEGFDTECRAWASTNQSNPFNCRAYLFWGPLRRVDKYGLLDAAGATLEEAVSRAKESWPPLIRKALVVQRAVKEAGE